MDTNLNERFVPTERYYVDGDPLNIIAKGEPEGFLTLSDEGVTARYFFMNGITVDLPTFLERYKSRGVGVELDDDTIVMRHVSSEPSAFSRAVEKFADVLEDVNYLTLPSTMPVSTPIQENFWEQLKLFLSDLLADLGLSSRGKREPLQL